ncbi:uncharacterized protein LOC107040982, partial [Diachasma alloeum]|uniref:uncharacterized protein LOC107040982 n=1 Tax=Diachasma alloeum TaxID=454923 RepID=UPI0007382629
MLVKALDETGWTILNGNHKGDEEGEFTREEGVNRTVIDYVLTDDRERGIVESMVVGEECNSDHFPLLVTVKGEESRRAGGPRTKGSRKSLKVSFWEREEREKLRRELEKMEWGEGSVDEMVKEVRERVKEIKSRIESEMKRKGKRWGDWWDVECQENKKGEKDSEAGEERE